MKIKSSTKKRRIRISKDNVKRSLEEFTQNHSIDDNYGILVTSDVKSLKSQINSLLAFGAFPVPRSPASDDN